MLGLEGLVFDAPAGARVHRCFHGVEVPPGEGKPALWWSYADRRWVQEPKGPASSHAPCRTLSAFRRHLRRHAGELAGRKVILASRFVGHDVTAEACR